MEREPIYLEKDDEITSVVDKLKNARGNTLDIVIPKEAMMLQSVINLKLLKKQADALGKEVTIVTQDKVGTKLAEQIGIPVVAKEGEMPKEVTMSAKEPQKPTEEDIEFKPNEKAEEVIAETPEKVAPENLNTESVQKPKASGGFFRKHWKGSLIGAGFLVLAIIAFAYIYIPLANVTITLAAEKKPVDIAFSADKNATGVDTAGSVIPARELSEELEKTETYQATGEKDVGEKATGSVTIYNNFSTTAKSLTAGDKLNAPGGLSYVLKSNVTVPGYTDPGGGKVAGKLEGVNVVASAVGEKYNLASGTKFTIPKIASSDFYAENGAAFTGGSTKIVKFVTKDDLAKAEKDLLGKIETELKAKMLEGLTGDEKLLEGALEVKKISASSDVAVDKEATEFKLTAKSGGKALIIKEADLLNLAENSLKQEIGDTKEIMEKDALVSKTLVTAADFKTGKFEATLAGEAYIATKLVAADLAANIAGDSIDSAKKYLMDQDGVLDVQTRVFPSFNNRMPRVKSHIYIKTEIDKTQQ